MSQDAITTVNLNRLALLSGQGKRLQVRVEPGQVELGGHTYVVSPPAVDAELAVSRTVAGYALKLNFKARIEGPCMRCLDPASVEVEIEAREVDQPPEGPDGEDREGELTSPYVEAGELQVEHWARDSLVLGLPEQVLCRAECPGLCPVCGKPMAGSEPGEHDHDQGGDPRWAKLSELNLGSE